MATEPKHVRKFRDKHLQSAEQIEAWGDGYIGEMMGSGKNAQKNGVLLVTGSRVVFYRAGIFGEVNESIPLKSITSIERTSFMGHRTIRMHTSHDSLEFKSFKKEQDQALVEAIEAGRGHAGAPIAAASAPEVVNDLMVALSKLADLKSDGVLTEEEFSKKKAELLARL
ncbi:PH domain-containing protein [Pseudomonas sp. BCRC 81390]|uniref:PH domain-containing protein n=1 Tax=Pseudomonas sp. BCRC 81390 TaxID=3054778 RepID=UPI0025948C04|nr:PH domain-containing protein [Pseudomonas sp. BCRC 81390]MDM3887038.1 PH domain-containing protein [Pseudomonas sp. BCRC 81390]